MASFEVLHTQNHSSDSFPSADFSFLPDVTTGSIPNGDINHHVNDNYDLTNMQSALAATMPSTAELHAQLMEIIEENKSLKEKLNKNNAMMKDQMNTISAWREHMMAAKNQLQESLLEAMEKIAALEKEKANLNECLKEIETENKTKKITSCEKCLIFDKALNDMLAIDSFENTESLLSELSYFREQLLPNLTNLCSFVEVLANSNVNEEDRKLLKTFVLLLKFKIAALEGGNSSAVVKTDEETGYEVVDRKSHENVVELHLAMEDLKKALDMKNNEVCSLKNEREELSRKLRTYECQIGELEMALKSKFDSMNTLDAEASLSEKYKERCEILQNQLEEFKTRLDKVKMSDNHVVKDLQEDVRNLQDILKLEQEANQEAKSKLAQVMLQCEKLQVDYSRVLKLFELESEKVKDITALKEKEAKEFLSKIDELTAQTFEIEEQKRECEGKIRDLETKLADIEEQANDIPLYRQQLELYEKDFATMKTAYEKATMEAQQIKSEVKKDEKKCDCCAGACNSHSGRRQRNGRSSDNQEQNVDIVCPFCNEKFKRKHDVERHLMREHKDEVQYSMIK